MNRPTTPDITHTHAMHDLVVASSLEGAIRYLCASPSLSDAELRSRLLDAVDRAHQTADDMYPLSVTHDVLEGNARMGRAA